MEAEPFSPPRSGFTEQHKVVEDYLRAYEQVWLWLHGKDLRRLVAVNYVDKLDFLVADAHAARHAALEYNLETYIRKTKMGQMHRDISDIF